MKARALFAWRKPNANAQSDISLAATQEVADTLEVISPPVVGQSSTLRAAPPAMSEALKRAAAAPAGLPANKRPKLQAPSLNPPNAPGRGGDVASAVPRKE